MDTNTIYEKCISCEGVYKKTIYNSFTFEETGFCFNCGERSSYIINRNEKNEIIYNKNGKLSINEDYHKKGYGLIFYGEENIKYQIFKSLGFYAFNNNVSHIEAFDIIKELEDDNKCILYCNILYNDKIINIFGKRPALFYKDIDAHIKELGISPFVKGLYKEELEELFIQQHNPFAETERFGKHYMTGPRGAKLREIEAQKEQEVDKKSNISKNDFYINNNMLNDNESVFLTENGTLNDPFDDIDDLYSINNIQENNSNDSNSHTIDDTYNNNAYYNELFTYKD